MAGTAIRTSPTTVSGRDIDWVDGPNRSASGADHERVPRREVGYTPSTMSPLLEDDPVVATVFECVGRPDVVQALLSEAPPHSRLVLADACHEPVELNPLTLTTAEVSVIASFAYRPADFHAALRHLQEQPERFQDLITSERPLDATAEAFDALANDPTEIKVMIHPSATPSPTSTTP